jgi:hypothetical protein
MNETTLLDVNIKYKMKLKNFQLQFFLFIDRVFIFES